MTPISVLQVVSTAQRVGVAGVVSLLARGLKRTGHEVRIVSLADGPLVRELVGYGLPADVVPAPSLLDVRAVFAMRAYLKRGRFDVVHTHGQRAMYVGNLAASMVRTPVVATSFHELSSVKATTSRWHRVYYTIEGVLARGFTDASIATSKAVFDDALSVRGVPRDRLVEIHNAVDWEKFRRLEDRARVDEFRRELGLDPGDLAIGALGSMEPIKGHRYLIEALPRIRERFPAARVVIAGFGPLRPELERRAAELGLGESVLFPGDVAQPALLYNGLDVFALPSLAESLPLVVLEAIACGTPVVASAVGGVPDLVLADRTGLLVPPGDVAALADAIVRMLEDRERRERFTAQALEHVTRNYSPEKFVERHAQLYRRVIEAKRQGVRRSGLRLS